MFTLTFLSVGMSAVMVGGGGGRGGGSRVHNISTGGLRFVLVLCFVLFLLVSLP